MALLKLTLITNLYNHSPGNMSIVILIKDIMYPHRLAMPNQYPPARSLARVIADPLTPLTIG
jgi:hypothetical protein